MKNYINQKPNNKNQERTQGIFSCTHNSVSQFITAIHKSGFFTRTNYEPISSQCLIEKFIYQSNSNDKVVVSFDTENSKLIIESCEKIVQTLSDLYQGKPSGLFDTFGPCKDHKHNPKHVAGQGQIQKPAFAMQPIDTNIVDEISKVVSRPAVQAPTTNHVSTWKKQDSIFLKAMGELDEVHSQKLPQQEQDTEVRKLKLSDKLLQKHGIKSELDDNAAFSHEHHNNYNNDQFSLRGGNHNDNYSGNNHNNDRPKQNRNMDMMSLRPQAMMLRKVFQEGGERVNTQHPKTRPEPQQKSIADKLQKKGCNGNNHNQERFDDVDKVDIGLFATEETPYYPKTQPLPKVQNKLKPKPLPKNQIIPKTAPQQAIKVAPQLSKQNVDAQRRLKKLSPNAFDFLSEQAKTDFAIGIVDIFNDRTRLSDYSVLLVPPYRGLERLIFDLQTAQGIEVKMIGQGFEKDDLGNYRLKSGYRKKINSMVYNEVLSALYTEYFFERHNCTHSDNSSLDQTRAVKTLLAARTKFTSLLELIDYNCKKLKEIGFSL